MVGLVSSRDSVEALWWAAGRAVERQADLRVVTVVDSPLTVAVALSAGAPLPDMSLMKERVVDWQQSIVADLLRSMPALYEVDASIEQGLAASVLCRESRDADLLVLGASRRRLFPLVRACRRRSRCPVVEIEGGRLR